MVRFALRLCLICLAATGCEAVAGIRDVTLASDATTDSTLDSTADTFTAETLGETAPSETATDADVETPSGKCASTRGPSMVEIAVGAKSFCIDATEVTNSEFAEYAKLPGSPTLPAQCKDVVLSFPGKTGADRAPQFNVSWCDAFAFCSWAGKRLCGRLDSSKPVASDNSEWTYVCTQGTTTAYPYGNDFDTTACVNGRPATDALPEPVASFGNCSGNSAPYTGVYDLSGNVSEWVDECEGTDCRALGGYYGDTDKNALKCASIGGTGMTVVHPVGRVLRGLGFRCCK